MYVFMEYASFKLQNAENLIHESKGCEAKTKGKTKKKGEVARGYLVSAVSS